MLSRKFRLLVALFAASVALPAGARDYEIGHLRIVHPWSRPVAAGQPVGVAYLSIANDGRGEDALLRASTPVAAQVQLHQTTLSEGKARMRPLDALVIAPGKTVRIEPGGVHLMLIDLKGALIAGTTVPLTLEFRVAGKITVPLKIEID
jgi:copper(I)-binding protein